MKKWMMLAILAVAFGMWQAERPASAARESAASAAPAQEQVDTGGLDYAFFKARVEPIFLKKRSGMARCYVCHEEANHALHLVKLDPGAAFWTEEESRKNFETVTQLVRTDDPSKSKLLTHPLAPEAGGDAFHSGGRQFKSKDDPDWKTISAWANGEKLK